MRKSFTLIELTIVIVIIAVLAALAIPQYTRMIERGRVSAAKAKLDTIRKAQGIHFALHSKYTVSNKELAIEVPELRGWFLDTGAVSGTDGDNDWSYSVAVPAGAGTFTATATRTGGGGEYNTKTITLDHRGDISGGNHPLE